MTQSQNSLICSDLPIIGSAEDKFTFTPFAKEVVSNIFKEEQPESLVVGLSGQWGSGKTSLLNLIDEQLSATSVNDKKMVTVRYVPWRVEDRKTLLSSFLPLLIEKIEEEVDRLSSNNQAHSDLLLQLKKYAEALEQGGPAIKAIAKIFSSFGYSFLEKGLELFGEVNSVLNEKGVPDIEQLYKQAYQALEELKIPLVVMIDDIDRLESSEIVELLRLVRATAQLPYITFILAYDQSHIMSAITKVLHVNGQEFLEKFVQLPIAVPLVDQSTLNSIVLGYIKTLYDSSEMQQPRLDKQYRFILDMFYTIEETEAISTPRDVFRILNTLKFRINLKTDELNIQTTIYLSILQTKFPLIFDWLIKRIERNKEKFAVDFKSVKFDLNEIEKFIDPNSSILDHVKNLIESTIDSMNVEITK